MIRRGALAALLLLAACGPPLPGPISLPGDALPVATDTGRQAILIAAYAFARPAAMQGRPADAATAIALAEYVAVDLAANPRWMDLGPLAQVEFAKARPEWRAAAGIRADAAPQAVIDTLFAARRELLLGNGVAAAAELGPDVFETGGEAALARLSALPRLPLTAHAAAIAEAEMARQNRRLDDD